MKPTTAIAIFVGFKYFVFPKLANRVAESAADRLISASTQPIPAQVIITADA